MCELTLGGAFAFLFIRLEPSEYSFVDYELAQCNGNECLNETKITMKEDEPGSVQVVAGGKTSKEDLSKIVKAAKENSSDSSTKALNAMKDAATAQADNKNKDAIKSTIKEGMAAAGDAAKDLAAAREQADKVVNEAKAEAKAAAAEATGANDRANSLRDEISKAKLDYTKKEAEIKNKAMKEIEAIEKEASERIAKIDASIALEKGKASTAKAAVDNAAESAATAKAASDAAVAQS